MDWLEQPVQPQRARGAAEYEHNRKSNLELPQRGPGTVRVC